jgi:hypothetical protein
MEYSGANRMAGVKQKGTRPTPLPLYVILEINCPSLPAGRFHKVLAENSDTR